MLMGITRCRTGEKKMRQIIILAALAAVIISLWSASTIVANSQKAANIEPATASMGVMQMMKAARDLPEQQFDAH
jgi:hypothetical protein